LERLFAERRQPVFRRQFAVDLGYYACNSLLTAGALSALLAVVAVGIYRLLPGSLLAFTAGLPLWHRMLATLVVAEFGFYWGHRWSHEIPLLWRFHAIHHSAIQIDWLTSTRGHPIDIIFTRLCGFGLVYLTGLAQVDAGPSGVVVSWAMIVTMFWGFFIHANLRWRLGWLEAVIATPAFHRWHHTNDCHRDHNYAATLPIYDWLFGTLYLPRNGAAPMYGSDAILPDGLVGQLLDPFSPSPLLARPDKTSTGLPPQPGPAGR
jgi:sterol desaturase/sphingolipid hydroxylase (fatty acid hydroxylase superfamily)